LAKFALWIAALGVGALGSSAANAQSMTLTSSDLEEGGTIVNEQVFKLQRSTTRAQICICLRWTTTPGGPSSSSCSAPRAVRAHMSMSGSRGNTGIPARSQPRKRCRRRQDIVLSASASIHPTSLRHAAEPKPIFCRQPVSKTALARAFNTRRRAPSFCLPRCYSHSHRLQQNRTRCHPATSDA
jgi:hypothetical protein